MEDRRLLWTLGITSGICWATWTYFLFFFDVGSSSSFWDPWRIVFYILLLLAPALTFVPIGLRLKWPFLGPYAVVGWAAFGYLLAFTGLPVDVRDAVEIGPASLQVLLRVWYFFPVLFVVVTSVLAPLAYAAGLRIFTSRMHRRDTFRAWREAGLLSLYLVGLGVGRSLSMLTWPIALLSLLLLALVEALFLARKA